jgi:hypothetical protein
MPIWRIRCSDKSGRLHAIYCQHELAPGPAEIERAIQEHLLNLHGDKDAPPAAKSNVDGITFLGIDPLPT